MNHTVPFLYKLVEENIENQQAKISPITTKIKFNYADENGSKKNGIISFWQLTRWRDPIHLRRLGILEEGCHGVRDGNWVI